MHEAPSTVPFGELRVPALSTGELTANYRAADPAKIIAGWRLTTAPPQPPAAPASFTITAAHIA